MNRILAALLSSGLIFIQSLPSAAGGFVPVGVDRRVEDKVAFTVEDLRNGPSTVSLLMKPKEAQDGPHGLWCLSFTSENCKLEIGHSVQAHAILPVCSGNEGHCVASLFLETSLSGRVKAEQISGFATGFGFPSLESLDTPKGSAPSLWRVPGVLHLGGSDLYVVAVNSSFTVVDGQRISYGGISASIYPVVELLGSNYRPSAVEQVNLNGQLLWVHDNGEQGSNDGCVLTTTGKCWARTEFAPGTRAELNVRASNQIAGWLHGRLAAPTISISPVTSTQNLFSVNAEPVEVPIMYAETQYSTLSAEEKQLFENPFAGGGFANGKGWLKFPSYENRARVLISKFAKNAGDRAATSKSTWQFNSITNNQSQGSCYANQNGLVGLVTTNAMAYDQAAPEFEDGSLNYSVAGLHLMPDGSKALGVYDLLIRSDVARCLYGFSKAPVSAKVQVLTSNGENIVASTQVSEKDGWLKLAAYGFTFSEKKIKATIFQSRTAALQKYKGNAVNLTSAQRFQVQDFASKSKGATAVVCNSTYLSAKDKATAEARAKATCSYLKKLAPDVTTKAIATRVPKQSDSSKVYLKSS